VKTPPALRVRAKSDLIRIAQAETRLDSCAPFQTCSALPDRLCNRRILSVLTGRIGLSPEATCAAAAAFAKESAGAQDAIPPAAGSGQNPGLPGLDSNASVRRVFVCLRVSGGLTVIEAAHTNALGPRGMGQKTSDFSAIPLCTTHHRENPDSYHHLGEHWFAQAHQIQLPEPVQALNSRYALQCPSPIDSLFLMEASTAGNADWQPEVQLGAALPDSAGHLATTGHGRLRTGK
jgi:hypothetical protein